MLSQIVNASWKIIYPDMLPESKVIWEPILLDEVNKVLAITPVNFFLDF